jgi:hypothetical protein
VRIVPYRSAGRTRGGHQFHPHTSHPTPYTCHPTLPAPPTADKSDVDEALEWLRKHKEKDLNNALKLQQRQKEGEEVEVEEEEPEPDDPDIEVYICEPPPLRGM